MKMKFFLKQLINEVSNLKNELTMKDVYISRFKKITADFEDLVL